MSEKTYSGYNNLHNNRVLALVWRLVLVICSLAGIPCIFAISMAYHPERQLYYFTMQTNFFVLFMFLALIVKTIMQIAKDGKVGEVAHLNYSLQLFVTYGITITFLGYVVLLAGMGFTMANVNVDPALQPVYEAGNWLVHIIVPFMAIIDWILFMPHGNIKKKAIGSWLVYPTVYMIILAIRAAVEQSAVFVIGFDKQLGKSILSQYPYFFIAFETFQGWQTFLILVALVVFFVLFGLFYIWADKKLSKFENK